MTKKTQEVQIIDLDKFNTSQLPELQNKKAELKKAIDEYPFIEITDTASYELAKKSRTGVKTIRTALEKEKKMVVGKIKENILNKVSEEYDNLLSEDVKPIEEKHQSEVTRWEEIKEQERLEKIRIEEERIIGIKSKVIEFEQEWNDEILTLEFENIEKTKEVFEKEVETYDYNSLQEFAIEFKAKLAFLRTKLEDKAKVLIEKEEIRLEQERLENERKEARRIQGIKDAINNFYRFWKEKIQIATIESIANLQEEFESIETLNYSEFQADYEAEVDRISREMDEKFRTLLTAEEQRISQEKFLEEKRQFEEEKKKVRTEKRIKEITELGFSKETDNGMFSTKIGKQTLNIADWSLFESDDDVWQKDVIQVYNKELENYNLNQNEVPITEDQEFEPETKVEDSDFIQEVDFEEIEETAFNVEKMTFEEKQSALIDWISKREEYELDALIKQYLN